MEGVRIDGAILTVGASAPVRDALRATGAELVAWERFGPEGAEEPQGEGWDRVSMRLPRGRQALRATLHLACSRLRTGGKLWLYGLNDEGVRSAGKALAELFERVETIETRMHGRVWLAEGRVGEPLPLSAFHSDVVTDVAGRTLRFTTLPGVFSDGRLDAGTRHLLEHLVVAPDARVLDLGCGAGVIGAWLGIGSRWTGVDHDAWALRCARRNVPDGEVMASDVWSALAGRAFDHIVSNPPFHQGNSTDLRVVEALIEGAPRHLAPGGRLTFVCPVTLPVQAALRERFHEVQVIGDNRSTRVWSAR